MSFRKSVYLLAMALAAGASMLGAAASVSAHEHRAVGNYELTVGFLNEPALLNEPNGLSLDVTFFPAGYPPRRKREHTRRRKTNPSRGWTRPSRPN